MMGGSGMSSGGQGMGMSLSNSTEVVEAVLSHGLEGTVTAADMQMMNVMANPTAYAQAALGASPLASVSDPTTFVTLMYETMLARAPDAAGLQYWVNQMSSGGVSQTGIMMSFANSSESLSDAQSSSWLNAMAGTNGASAVIGVSAANQTQAMEAIMSHALQGAVTTTDLQAMTTAASPTAYAQSCLAASPLASVTDPTTFVTLMYQTMLGRAPDAAGLQYWVNQMGSGGANPVGIMMSFANSSEALSHAQSQGWMSATVGASANTTGITLASPTQVMEALISHALNGTVTAADAQMMTTAASPTAYAQAALAASPLASVTDPTTFVTDMYQDLVGRAPDAGGLQYWTTVIASNGGDRSAALVGISNSAEAITHAHAMGWL